MWQKNGGSALTNDTNKAQANQPKPNDNRISSNVDDSTVHATNAPFSGYNSTKKPFKPQYVNDNPSVAGASGKTVRPRMGAARFGQGGFARVFRNQSGKPDVGAAASGPSGAMSGLWGT